MMSNVKLPLADRRRPPPKADRGRHRPEGWVWASSPGSGDSPGGSAMNGALSQGMAVPRFLPEGAPVRAGQTTTDLRQLPAKVDRQPATVLVVDDEPRMRRVARRMLSELGYQVLEAENAAAAASLLNTDASIDLLFTDVVMPGELDGRALGHLAQQARPGLGVLLTSGFSQHAAAEDSPGSGPLPLLGKPFSKEQLQKAIQTLLRGQRS